jgi:hypothetical protein
MRTLTRCLLIVAACVVIHGRVSADSSMVSDEYFDTSSSWSSGGGNSLYFDYDSTYHYYVRWTGLPQWNTLVDIPAYGPWGYGTHTRQTVSVGSGSVLYMGNDGNVMLIAYPNTPYWTIRWQTNTAGNFGGFLRLQDGGNLVVYTPSNVPVWSLY